MQRWFRNIWALIYKETLLIWKDKRGRVILVMPIVIQTILFGFVATFDLNRAEYALLDMDHSQSSREFVRLFDSSEIFHRTATLQNQSQLQRILDEKRAQMVLVIPSDFGAKLSAGTPVQVGAVISGVNSNVASALQYYVQKIAGTFNAERAQTQGVMTAPLTVVPRVWFNPNLETRWSIISALIAVLAVIQVIILAGQSVAREKELQTFDQLLVTPLDSMTIMVGKAIPPVLVGLLQSSIVFFVSMAVFKIPFSGSVPVLYLGLLFCNFAVVGIGLCISVLSKTMQQAMLYSFTVLMPTVLLSGFATPLSAMPEFFRSLTYLNPLRYAVEYCQRVYLEGAGLRETAWMLGSLLLIAAVTMALATLLFKRRVG